MAWPDWFSSAKANSSVTIWGGMANNVNYGSAASGGKVIAEAPYSPDSNSSGGTYFRGGHVWIQGGNGTTGVSTYIITNAAALSFPALHPDPTNVSPNGVQEVPNNTTSADRAAYFPGQTNTTIYASFLLNYQDNGGATADRCAFSLITGGTSTTNGGSVSSVYTAVWLTPDYRLQVTKNYNKASANFSASSPPLPNT